MAFNMLSAESTSPTKSSRHPLLPRILSTNHLPSDHVRRKASFFHRVDSSEEVPSPRDSIYEAFSLSANNSDDSNNRVGSWSKVMMRAFSNVASQRAQENNENNREPATRTPTIPIDDIEFRYGHGTPLQTITEKNSSTTMSTLSRRKSADDLPTVPFLQHRDSFIVAKSPRRKRSFSVNDIALIEDSYHHACAFIDSPSRTESQTTEIYAQPRTPIQAPPERPPTPPGMLSWTETQALTSPQRSVQARLGQLQRIMRFFTSSNGQNTTALPDIFVHASIPRTRSVSAPISGRRASRFRPPRSVYGPIDQHPFHGSLPMANVSPRRDLTVGTESSLRRSNTISTRPSRKRRTDQRVRFTPSATARDSENLTLTAAIEATSTAALHPLSTLQPATERNVNSPNEKQCPHRKGRQAALEALGTRGNRVANSPGSAQSSPHSEASIPLVSTASTTAVSGTPESLRATTPDFSAITTDSVLELGATRAVSLSSTAPLMAEAPSLPYPTPAFNSQVTANAFSSTSLLQRTSGNRPVIQPLRIFCWKCKVEHIFGILDRVWAETTSFLCFVCCGFDLKEDVSVSSGEHRRRGAGSAIGAGMGMSPCSGPVLGGSGGFARDGRELRGPRVVTLERKGAIRR